MLFPVFYTRKRVILDGVFKNTLSDKLNKLRVKKINRNLSKISDYEYEQYFLYLQSFKHVNWAFEKEIRAIKIDLSDDSSGNQQASSYGLQPTKIIAGYLSEYKEDLKQIATDLGISFSIMRPDFSSKKYNLVEQNVL